MGTLADAGCGLLPRYLAIKWKNQEKSQARWWAKRCDRMENHKCNCFLCLIHSINDDDHRIIIMPFQCCKGIFFITSTTIKRRRLAERRPWPSWCCSAAASHVSPVPRLGNDPTNNAWNVTTHRDGTHQMRHWKVKLRVYLKIRLV